MDAQQYNRELDAKLDISGIVDRELFLRLADAYSADTATHVHWVEAKLKVLARRMDRGEPLSLFDREVQGQTAAVTKEQFMQWVLVHFPGVEI